MSKLEKIKYDSAMIGSVTVKQWFDAKAFMNWIGDRGGLDLRDTSNELLTTKINNALLVSQIHTAVLPAGMYTDAYEPGLFGKKYFHLTSSAGFYMLTPKLDK